MAVEPETGGGRRHLALAVRLHDAAGDQAVGAGGDRLVEHGIELAQLVAAAAEAGQVLALDPQRGPAEMAAEPTERLERRREAGQPEAREPPEPVGQDVEPGARLLGHRVIPRRAP